MEGFTMPSEVTPEAAGMVGIACLAVVAIIVVIVLAVCIVLCVLISNCFKRIPQQHREMEPGMVWLLLIPCFNIVWNFFVWSKLEKSYKNYFDSVGIQDVGDCGHSINLAFCIVTACCLIPYVNRIAGLASLVLFILCLIKANELKNRIPLDADRLPQDSGGMPPM